MRKAVTFLFLVVFSVASPVAFSQGVGPVVWGKKDGSATTQYIPFEVAGGPNAVIATTQSVAAAYLPLTGGTLTGSQTVLPPGGNGIVMAGTNSAGIPSITATGAANNITLALAGKGAANVTVSPGLTVSGNTNLNGDLTITGKFETLIEEAGGQFKITNNGSALSGPSAAFVLQGTNPAGPAIGIGNTSQGADGKWWDIMPVANALNFRTVTDGGAPSATFLSIVRSGAVVSNITSNSGTGSWTHTGDMAVSGALIAGSGTLNVYSASGVAVTTPHIVTGTVTLSSGAGTATFTGNAIYSNATSYNCTATDTTSNSAVKVTPVSASSVSFSGAATDVIAYQCIGN